MLMKIPRIISPDLMRAMMQMGHGDILTLGDANFPAHKFAKDTVIGKPIELSCDIPSLLDAILTFFPLDYATTPVSYMAVPPTFDYDCKAHDIYTTILKKHGYMADKIETLPRFDLYNKARTSYAIVLTGETMRFANITLQKGVVIPE